MNHAAAMLTALALEVAIGWPDAAYRRIGHPVVWIGQAIAALDQKLNFDHGSGRARKTAGFLCAVIIIGAAAAVGWLLQSFAPSGWAGAIYCGLLGAPLIAARSLHEHVRAVLLPLEAGDLSGTRLEVGKIVGRDPAQLDQAGVARAAIESLAENASDGVVAPLFWGLLFGLPGLAAYKAVNTLDSMIGHRTPRYEMFGWASARIDDFANLAPARLTGLIFALASGRPKEALRGMSRDAPKHRSPNAGWPEAAMAHGLKIRLSGPRFYADARAQEPWINEGARDPTPPDLFNALKIYKRLLGALVLMLALLSWI